LPPIKDPKVIVGTSTRDDAAVYRLNDETALVQSVDVFTPVVDDPYIFGQVAAANSLSDIYAMGARPIFAVCLIGFPVDKLPISDMGEILRGGIDKAREAGIEVAGGHSLEDNEPKYGLCVTGVVHPDRILRNSSARPGDVLILTKPLGSGILAHAIKKGRASEGEIREVVEVMARLNRDACEAMVEVGASACTDVTGFGLLGHLVEMVQGSGVSARIRASRVPVLGSVRSRVRDGICPGGTRKNLDFFGKYLDWDQEVEEVDRLVLADAQTSGGLLIAVPRERAEALQKGLEGRGVETREEIGEILPSTGEPRIRVWLD
jgi:selenide,water dikinase